MRSKTRVIALVAVVALTFPAAFVMLLLAALTTGVLSGCSPDGAPTLVGPRSWTAEQTANGQGIVRIVIERGLPRRAAVLAVATAIVESGLRNVAFGDRDSLGLYQQRPSQGWGTPATILNPASATASFLDRLTAIPGWHALPPGVAAQLVQRSAFPDRYGPQESTAAALVALFWTGADRPLNGLPGLPAPVLAACPDTGGSDTPLPPGSPAARALPPGFAPPADPRARAAVMFAAGQLGKPYVWGATGPGSYDCSGLMQAAWAAAGVPVSRSTTTQVHDGIPVSDMAAVQPGDLLFIPGSRGTAARPRHVGIYAGHRLVINAYDSRHGVIVEDLAAWAPKIVAIRRVTAPTAGDPR